MKWKGWIPVCAAAFTLGFTMTSYAASGWQKEDGTWRYYNSDGSRESDTWKKSGDHYFYLDEYGDMAVSSLIETDGNYYYVNSQGARVSNEWRLIDNVDSWDDDADAHWYYFQSNGKAYKAPSSGKTSFKTIRKANGEQKKYAFDEQGRMLYGWVNENSEKLTEEDAWRQGVYYLGEPENGELVSASWMSLDVEDDDNDSSLFDGSYWFYFGTNGKKITDTTKTINGRKYRFDDQGAAQFDWYQLASSSEAGTASPGESHLYYNLPTQCWLATGWFKTVPGYEVDPEAYDNDDEYWFYAQKSGELVKNAIRTINGYQYGFNEKGEMLHGLYKLETDGKTISGYEKIETYDDLPDASEDCKVYYFGDSPKEGVMKKGSATIDLDGEKFTYQFKKSGTDRGAGYNQIYDGSIYIHGRMLKAEREARYQTVNYDGKTYLINTSGKLVKNRKNVRDTDEIYYSTDKDGVVIYTGSEKQ